MQLSSDAQIPDGLLAANALLSEKPHQGVPSWNLAPHQGIDERNSTAAIGIRASAQLNRICPRYTGKERDAESGNDYFEARYYSSAMGHFMSPDWAAKEDPVPYATFDDPQSLNLYSYVRNNPLSKADAGGHEPSDLTYDGSTHTLTLTSSSGQEIGSWHANNNVDSRASLGKLPNGTYPVVDQNSPHTHGDAVDSHDSNKQDSSNGEYGSGGIFRMESFKGPDGKMHEGVGVHAGREDKPDGAGRKGPDHATQGCIRTCDAAIKKITDTAKTDPLKTVTVQNNRQPAPAPTPQPKKDGQQ